MSKECFVFCMHGVNFIYDGMMFFFFFFSFWLNCLSLSFGSSFFSVLRGDLYYIFFHFFPGCCIQ